MDMRAPGWPTPFGYAHASVANAIEYEHTTVANGTLHAHARFANAIGYAHIRLAKATKPAHARVANPIEYVHVRVANAIWVCARHGGQRY